MPETKPQWTVGYKEVKNYLHNELGLTKEQIDNVIQQIAKNQVTEILGQNGEFIRYSIRDIIRQEMMFAMNEQKYPRVGSGFWDHSQDDFKKFIQDTIREEILNMMRNQFEVKFEFEKKTNAE